MTADQAQRWDASTDNPHETLSGFQESLPVRLIATARQNFKTCRPDEAVSNVVERNRDDSFDFMPVLGPEIPVVRSRTSTSNPSARSRETMAAPSPAAPPVTIALT